MGSGTWLLLGAAAVVAAACSTTDPAEVAALEERVAVLEVEVAQQSSSDTDDRLAELAGEVAGLEEELGRAISDRATLTEDLDAVTADVALLLDAFTVLEEELAALGDGLRAELADIAETQRQATADLDSRLAGVSGRVDRAASDLEELRTIIVTVRDRLDRCQADGSC